jgi:[acyl-carrier-protein] S-malonyltransferase
MGYSLSQKFSDFEPILNEVLREADANIGFSLSQIIKDGPADKLKETEITQPALLTVSTAMSRWLKSKGKSAGMATGHSLGEYSALVHAEALRFQDAVKLVHLRGKLMQEAVPLGQGGMAALIGATPETAQKLCTEISTSTGKVLEPSVYNSPGQVVVSGSMEAIDEACQRVKEFGIRMAAKLEVSGPFHCSLLNQAGLKLMDAMNKIEWTKPKVPVISNVTSRQQWDAQEIKTNLMNQVSQAVRFEQCIRHAIENGFRTFVEVGSGKVLTGIIKKISAEVSCVPLEEIQSLDQIP